MKRARTPRIIPPRLKLREGSPDVRVLKALEIRSAHKSNDTLNEATLPRSNSFNYSPAHFNKMKDLIKGLEDENKKLVQENFRVREENNNLVKANKELSNKRNEQQKYIDRLCGEVSKMSQKFCIANLEGSNRRIGIGRRRSALWKKNERVVKGCGSLGCLVRKNKSEIL
jgi:FtsZ-binding cell division protein ZapB